MRCAILAWHHLPPRSADHHYRHCHSAGGRRRDFHFGEHLNVSFACCQIFFSLISF